MLDFIVFKKLLHEEDETAAEEQNLRKNQNKSNQEFSRLRLNSLEKLK